VDPKRWLTILVLILILGVFLNVPLLVTLTTSLAVVIGVAYWWRIRALDNILYRRKFHYTRAFPGEDVQVQIEVENRKLLPVSWLRIRDPWPRAIGPDDEDILAPSHLPKIGQLVNIFSLRWFELNRRIYNLRFRKRGVYTVGPVQLESGDLFGIYSETRKIGHTERLTVFPRLVPIQEMDLPAENPFGDRRSRRRMFEDPNRPMGVREYQPEDSFRRVHWPATARTGNLQVKIYQPTTAQVMVVCLNAATFPHYWEGVNPELLEYLVQVAASLIYQGMQDGYQVGLISNGSLANADQAFRVQPGRSPKQLAHVLQALAGVTPLVSAPFDRFLLRELPRVPYGSTLTVITAVLTENLRETLLKIKQHGRRIVLISLAEDVPSYIPGIHIIHLPFKPGTMDFDDYA
jgi:uncharacterized protein (DUF58 family)